MFKDDRFEFVFQFVEGQTLRQILQADETLQLTECRIWFDQIASALEHAHHNGIIHRDIKPENMIVTPDRKHCYLVDFGIALSKSELERLTGSDNWIGTPGYMSPEQVAGEGLDSSDDVYVLGICLYEALSGHKLEPGEYRPLNTLSELIPPAIDSLVKKCIAQKPRRLKTASEFRNLLRTALLGHRTISEVLAAGQLHEVVGAIASMTPVQFMEMKVSQRLLILQKCQDLAVADDRRLVQARNEFLSVMANLGIHLDSAEYTKVIDPCFHYGFGAIDDYGVLNYGVQTIRESLIDAASAVSVENHRVIVKSLLGWSSKIKLEDQKSGLYHSVRLLISALMANPECHDDDAPQLAKILNQVNELQRHKAYEADVDQAEFRPLQSLSGVQ